MCLSLYTLKDFLENVKLLLNYDKFWMFQISLPKFFMIQSLIVNCTKSIAIYNISTL